MMKNKEEGQGKPGSEKPYVKKREKKKYLNKKEKPTPAE